MKFIFRVAWGFGEKLVLFPEMLHDWAQATMFSEKLESRFWPNTLDGFEIVTSQQDTQFDELHTAMSCQQSFPNKRGEATDLRHVHFESFKSFLEVDFADGLLLGFGKGEMSVKDGS